ncbi:hypothetical protein D021_3042A, partial [Vibrio parahaemolyticus 10296]
MAANISCQF